MDMDATPDNILVLKAFEVRDKAKTHKEKTGNLYRSRKTWTCYGWHWKRL